MEVGGGEDAGIEVTGDHETDVLGTSAVLGRCDPLQVFRTPIIDVAVDMVALATGRSRTNPSQCHDRVTHDVSILPHRRIARVTQPCVSWWTLVHDDPSESPLSV